MEEQESSSDLPDSLLAFAKDHRYIRRCQDLLKTVFERDVDAADLWWWSALLYATLVVGRKGRTLGMEFVGLKHSELSPLQQRMGKFALFAGWALWMRQCLRIERCHVEEQRHERLRGAARQYFYQQQRRAMLQRATRSTTEVEASAQPLNPSSISNGVNERASSDFVERMKQGVSHVVQVGCLYFIEECKRRCPSALAHFLLLQIMSEAISSSSDNPHALPDTSALLSSGRWILRLSLAHYCITGRYPTWWHRLFGLSVQREGRSRISDPPATTHPLVGRLILIQTGAILSQNLARWIVSYVTSRRIETEEASGSDDTPGEGVSALSHKQLCGICRMPRSHSAAPSSCGHVFCWRCLYQWVSTVRPECPLCRSACRPQDIIALHNYAPT